MPASAGKCARMQSMEDARAVTLRQLYDGAQRGNVGQVQALLAVLPSDYMSQVNCALTAAVRNDHADIVAVFAAVGADTWTETPQTTRLNCAPQTTRLNCAVRHGSVHVAAFLVAAKASVHGADSVRYERPLHTATGKGHLSCVSLLLAMKASTWVDNAIFNALHFAARSGHADVVECLLRAKADHQRPNRFSETPLYLAACGQHEPVMRVLLGVRADVNPPSPCTTPLWGAARQARSPGTVQLLLGARADVNATLDQGYTALCLYVAYGCPDAVVKLLLCAKADVHAASVHGHTALHIAARDGRRSTAHLLVRAKADVHATSTSGNTAAACALLNKHVELAEYLKTNVGV